MRKNSKQIIHKWTQKLVFGKEAAQIFASGASDHCWIARRKWRPKICSQADAAKNQLLSSFVYNNLLPIFYRIFASNSNFLITKRTQKMERGKAFFDRESACFP